MNKHTTPLNGDQTKNLNNGDQWEGDSSVNMNKSSFIGRARQIL